MATIIIDTREQLPLSFEGFQTKSEMLEVGDYSIEGLTNSVSVERKSLPDLLMCMTSGRERFEKELLKLRGFRHAFVLVEGSFDCIITGTYRSQMHPHAALATLTAWHFRYGIPFLFFASRKSAEIYLIDYFKHVIGGYIKQYEIITGEKHGQQRTTQEAVSAKSEGGTGTAKVRKRKASARVGGTSAEAPALAV